MSNNERGAGRKPNPWTSRKVDVPDPIREQVLVIINQWKLEQKKNGKND